MAAQNYTPQHADPDHTHHFSPTRKHYLIEETCIECGVRKSVADAARIESLEQQIAAMRETFRYIARQGAYKGLARAQEAAIVWLPEDEQARFDRLHRGEETAR